MERFRRMNGRAAPPGTVTNCVDRSSDDCFNSIDQGKRTSDSSSCVSSITAEVNLLAYGQEGSCSRLPTGTPMKKLLADEMSKECESKRRPHNIIARLLGLDGLPAQQNTGKQYRRVLDNQQQDAGSSGFRKSSKLLDTQSLRKNAKHQPKSAYEVVGCSNLETSGNTSRATSIHDPSNVEIAYIRQKFMDVKHFSADKNFQCSKEFHDALEVLDSNKDVLLRFLQEPNSLFAKHLRDLHCGSQSLYGRALSMKSANTLKSNIDALGCQSGGKASWNIDICHSQKHLGSCYSNSYNRCSTDSEESEDATSMPTRIVVLKPNLVKEPKKARSASTPSPSHNPVTDVDVCNECPNLRHSGSEKQDKGDGCRSCDSYGRNYRESRELARVVTLRMKNKVGADFINVYSAGYNGYSADESSHDLSENDSCDSEFSVLSIPTSYDGSICKKASTSHHTESFVNCEAKRRLSERWKMSHRSQEVRVTCKGRTLAEMLSIPDLDIRPQDPGAVVAQDEFCKIRRTNGTFELIAPLGISSRVGWKDGCIQSLSRSRSLPASSGHLGSPKSNTRSEALAAERFRKESSSNGRSRTIMRDSKSKDGSCSESSSPSNKKLPPYYPLSMEMIDDTREVRFRRNVVTTNLDGKGSPEVKSVIFEMSSSGHDTNTSHDAVEDRKPIGPNEPFSPGGIDSGDPPPDSFTCDLPSVQQKPSKSYDVGCSTSLQCAAMQPESSASSKESEQPSPVSVLEAPFVEDLSSGSECFERVSAELSGLRMQLRLLKLESEAHDEGSMLVSSDEDGEESNVLHDFIGHVRAPARWESTYLTDVLNGSELDDTDPDLFLATWYSPDCPIGRRVFENLEKKYSGLESCLKSDRKMLFDLINLRTIEISQQYVNLHPWIKNLRRNVGARWPRDGFKAELLILLENPEKKTIDIEMDTLTLGNTQWLDLEGHINIIGRDIERLLIDGLLAELIPL